MPPTFRDILTDAIRYWEIRRIPYNAILALVSVTAYLLLPEAQREKVTFGSLAGLTVLIVIANLLYCAAYVPDVAVQLTAFRDVWKKYRFLLFVFGTLFASLLAFLCTAPVGF